jgi:hypothetical protein
MQLQKTIEEILASRLKPRNYSEVLSIIYSLRRREKKDYFPESFSKKVLITGAVGGVLSGNTASATFNVLKGATGNDEKTSFQKGDSIKLGGSASYPESSGGVVTLKPAILITAFLDIGRSQTEQSANSLSPQAIQCLGTQVQSNGTFEFFVSSEITSNLSVGRHYIYIDAQSPNNPPTRLTASGTGQDIADLLNYNVRTFTITA